MGTLAGPLDVAAPGAVRKRFIVAVVTEDVSGRAAWWQRAMQSSALRPATMAVLVAVRKRGISALVRGLT